MASQPVVDYCNKYPGQAGGGDKIEAVAFDEALKIPVLRFYIARSPPHLDRSGAK